MAKSPGTHADDPKQAHPKLSTHPLVEESLKKSLKMTDKSLEEILESQESQGKEAQPQALVPLIGYIGPPQKNGMIRLYRDLGFDSYFEVSPEAIVDAAPVNEKDGLSPTAVYVLHDTQVKAVHSRPAEFFLRGGITSQHLKSAGRPGEMQGEAGAAHPIHYGLAAHPSLVRPMAGPAGAANYRVYESRTYYPPEEICKRPV
jgi:hypothetical protein